MFIYFFDFQTDCKYIAFILIKKHLQNYFSKKVCMFISFFLFFYELYFCHSFCLCFKRYLVINLTIENFSLCLFLIKSFFGYIANDFTFAFRIIEHN